MKRFLSFYLVIVSICSTVQSLSQQGSPVFKTAKELSEPFQPKQSPPDLFQLGEEIISGTKKTPQQSIAENSTAATSAFHLTKDLNSSTNSSPSNYSFQNINNHHFAVLNNVSYFWADDGIHGSELWRSNGTPSGTYMVKDIVSGKASSAGSEIVVVNNKIFFRAAGPDQVWVSDGTEAGTQLIKTIPGTGGNTLEFFFAGGNYLYFVATTPGSTYNQLWKSDGTTAGTILLYDAGTSNPGWGITHLAFANNILYFTNSDFNYGNELWRSDGTPSGTHMVKDINPGNNDFYDEGPDNLTAYNNRLYFTESDGTNRKLWMADASGNNAFPATGYNEITFPPDQWAIRVNKPFAISNGFMYFLAYSPQTGNELYKYDAVNGASLVKDITPGIEESNINRSGSMTDVNNILYFTLINSNNQYELWKTKGKANNTQLVKSFNSSASYLFNAFGTLIFAAANQINGSELWKSDGTEAGTILLKDIYPGPLSSAPYIFTTCNNRVLFSAFGNGTGVELWGTNGTPEGTRIVKDINKTSTGSSGAGSNARGIIAIPDGVMFVAQQDEYGLELYKSDGTETGTSLVKDINAGGWDSNPRYFLNKNNYAYFFDMGYNESNIWEYRISRSDGTAGGTSKILGTTSYIQSYTVTDNGLIFYVIYNSQTYKYELWRSDGTTDGHFILTAELRYDTYPLAVGNTVFFTGGNDLNGYELWKTNGTVAGTKMVKDINPGVNSSSPFSLFAYNSNVFFGAFDGSTTSFWRSNGTANGTVKVKDINPVYYYNPWDINNRFCISNDTLYVVASDPLNGSELWKTTGTANSTKLVKDIYPGSIGSSPHYLRSVNTALYFQANDGTNGTELWVTDGTVNGTKLTKNITPGSVGSYYKYPSAAAGKLYFVLNDTIWVSEGTSADTKQVSDAGLNGLSNIQYLTGSGNKLFFGAYTYQYGSELYVGDLTTGTFTVMTSDNSVAATSKFDAKVYPNPAKNAAHVKISGDVKKLNIMINDMNGKNVWQETFNNATQINLPVERLVPGIYFVMVSNGTESKVTKLVKQ